MTARRTPACDSSGGRYAVTRLGGFAASPSGDLFEVARLAGLRRLGS